MRTGQMERGIKAHGAADICGHRRYLTLARTHPGVPGGILIVWAAWFSFVIVVACQLFHPGGAQAQNITATIQGVVSDSSGARIGGASIVVTNMETNVVSYVGTTDQQGAFHATRLPVGLYQLTVKAASFSDEEFQNIYANVDQTIDKEIRMVPSESVQNVVVEAENTIYLAKSSLPAVGGSIVPETCVAP